MRVDKISALAVNRNNDNKNRDYNQSFKRQMSEHVSWGANLVKETGKANFKLFSFPDAKAVFVEVANKAGTKFGKIWERVAQVVFAQGAALSIDALNQEDNETKIYPMVHKGEGVYEAKDINASAGSQYRYIVVDGAKNINIVKDPYSKQQSDVNGWSEIYDSDNYEWKSIDWLEGKDSRRIVRKPEEKLRGLEDLFIEEINIPTLSEEGSFEKAKGYIDNIVSKGYATAIEIMPVENTFSLQWGYDGVDKFAVNPKMGTQAELKELIDYAHGNGLNVIMDAVPNHIGPDGNYLPKTGPYRKNAGEFGDVPNYEGHNNKYVRDWMANAMLWWVNEFKVDGLRLDMTKNCASDYLLKQIVEEVNHHNPDVFLIAEDGRDNKFATTQYNTYKLSHEDSLGMIDENVNNIAYKNWQTYPAELGYDTEWDFPLMHVLKDTLADSKDLDMWKLDHLIKNSKYRVKYVMSHDEIGNIDGTRLIPKAIAAELGLFFKVPGESDAQKGQRAAHLGQKLAEFSVQNDLNTVSDDKLKTFARQHGMVDSATITTGDLRTAFNIAKARHKLSLAVPLTIPGPKMFFQGDDEMNLSRFKFFREFSSDSYDRENEKGYVESIINQKGYDTLEAIARKDSMIDSVPQSETSHSEEIRRFSSDLIGLVKGSKALKSGDMINTWNDFKNNIHIHQLKKDDDEVLVIKNFGNTLHDKNYWYSGFPDGNWKEVFNSDSEIYGGGNNVNEGKNSTINRNKQNLTIAPNSVIILQKIK